MPVPTTDFDRTYPCEFFTPEELLDAELMYTVPEIARLLQGMDPDAELDPDTEAVLIDWAIPWIVINADELSVAEPRDDAEPGYFGRRS